MTMTEVWRTERRTKYANPNGNKRGRRRTPFLAKLAHWAAKSLPRFETIRRVTLLVGAVALIDLSAWQFTVWAGLLVTGLSLFVLDWMFSDA